MKAVGHLWKPSRGTRRALSGLVVLIIASLLAYAY